jgi:Mrp family chromosome partitioning ATPase
MAGRIHPRTIDDLERAVREVEQLAGITSADGPTATVIGITSPSRGSGKSTLATALAAQVAADHGVDVTLVDVDCDTHAIEGEFGLKGSPGFTDALLGAARAADVRHPVGRSNLGVIPVGRAAADLPRTIHSPQAAQLLQSLRDSNRVVVFDLPPTLSSSTAPLLARLCDSVIVVVQVGKTTTMELEQTLRKLRGVDVRGVVLNRWRTRIPGWVESALGLSR